MSTVITFFNRPPVVLDRFDSNAPVEFESPETIDMYGDCCKIADCFELEDGTHTLIIVTDTDQLIARTAEGLTTHPMFVTPSLRDPIKMIYGLTEGWQVGLPDVRTIYNYPNPEILG
jgi:hypothetical protein